MASGGSPTAAIGLQINNPNSAGTPKTGGTLTVLGTSDVDDNLDPNIGYYTLDYVAYWLYERNLYTYPERPGPDLHPGSRPGHRPSRRSSRQRAQVLGDHPQRAPCGTPPRPAR